LITPVYVPPTVVPPPSLVTEVPGACDDEETDCITGSGFGPTSSIDDSATTIKSIKLFNILIITYITIYLFIEVNHKQAGKKLSYRYKNKFNNNINIINYINKSLVWLGG